MSTTYMTATLKLADGTIVYPTGSFDNMVDSLIGHTLTVPASLDANGKVPAAQLPVDTTLTAASTDTAVPTAAAAWKAANNKTFYVATTGNDANAGTADAPLATIDKALELGANRVLLFGGKYIQYNIDLSKCASNYLFIGRANPTEQVILYGPTNTRLATTETQHSGDIYKATYTATRVTNWMFQDSVSDPHTTIALEDRMPEQKGKAYRCDCTRFEKCTSTTLEDALTEISNETTKWLFFDDAQNKTVYYKRPQAVDSDHALWISTGNYVFKEANIPKSLSLEMCGLEFRYIACNIRYMARVALYDCTCCCARSNAAFSWNQSNVTLVRCEGYNMFSEVNSGGTYVLGSADGFNAHSTNTGDAFAPQSRGILIDCWAHDNIDDGYSDHERCAVTIQGGLYEYNGQGGLTPAVGSHCTCYGVVSRYNGEGFFCNANPVAAEGGFGTQMFCVDCVAYGNSVFNSNYGYGFRCSGTNCTLICVRCCSLNNYAGYAGTGTTVLYDCTAAGNTVAVGSSVTIRNGTLVTAGA